MHWEPALWVSLTTVAAIWAITVISPGPNFLATAHAAVSRSRRHGLLVAAGIGLGTTLWATASLAGLAILFEQAGWLYHAVRLAGAAYLVYAGITMFRSARRTEAPDTALAGNGGMGGGFVAFRRGLVTDLSNPKAAAFFTSLFAVAVPAAAPAWFHGLLVAVVVGTAVVWYGVVALFMGVDRVARGYQKARAIILRVTGVVFIGFGLKLVADR